ncbi:MAG: hypothetical protein QM727_11175 [Niabella sp.]
MNKANKISLIEDYAAYFSSVFKFPPLAIKIYAYILLESSTGEEGVSFEELVEALQASKGSVSTNLSLLLQLKHVEETSHITCRKRYFSVPKNHISLRLKRIKEAMEMEKTLLEKLLNYLQGEDSGDANAESVKRMKVYSSHLNKVTQDISHTISELEKVG